MPMRPAAPLARPEPVTFGRDTSLALPREASLALPTVPEATAPPPPQVHTLKSQLHIELTT